MPVVLERSAHQVSTVTYCFLSGSMMYPPISLAWLRYASANASRAKIYLTGIERLPIMYPIHTAEAHADAHVLALVKVWRRFGW